MCLLETRLGNSSNQKVGLHVLSSGKMIKPAVFPLLKNTLEPLDVTAIRDLLWGR